MLKWAEGDVIKMCTNASGNPEFDVALDSPNGGQLYATFEVTNPRIDIRTVLNTIAFEGINLRNTRFNRKLFINEDGWPILAGRWLGNNFDEIGLTFIIPTENGNKVAIEYPDQNSFNITVD